RSRIVAFALSAGIAGFGGGLLAMYDGQANYAANFTPFFGLFWLVIVVTLGARTVEGAVQAGLALALFPELLKTLSIPPEYQFILFGLGALTFARITRLADVSLTVDRGEAVGLIGPNGAGKTTFFNCLLGMLRPDRGSVRFDGRDVTRAPVYRRARRGLGRTFQRIELFGGMTV